MEFEKCLQHYEKTICTFYRCVNGLKNIVILCHYCFNNCSRTNYKKQYTTDIGINNSKYKLVCVTSEHITYYCECSRCNN